MTGASCNLGCPYCYVTASRRNQNRMDRHSVRTLVRNCSRGFDSIEFCWHGGEPLLAGRDFYEAVVEAQAEVQQRSKYVQYKNCIQTNGTLLNDDWLTFLGRNGFHVGFSFDAPPDVHIRLRGDNVERLLEVYSEAKRRGFPLGLLCVITDLNVRRGAEIFEFCLKVGANSYSLLPLKQVPLDNRPAPPTNDDLFDLYRTTFDLWARTQNEISCIEPITTFIASLLGERPRACSFASSCLKRMITIDQNGNVVPCSSLVNPEFVLGNIFQEPLDAILHSTRAAHYGKLRTRAVSNYCAGCDFLTICRGGCRADAYWHTKSFDGAYPYCGARKQTFRYLQNKLNHLVNDDSMNIAAE